MAITRVYEKDGRCIEYERRQPEKTVFYKLVQKHILTVFAQAEAQSEVGYPSHVKREFERFMDCGILAAGFSRITCEKPGCKFERLVGYSCKSRCVCPSCISRRMADCAAHLVDHLLPLAPYRQWTLSLPYKVRFRIAYNKALTAKVLSIFLSTIFAWQRRQARRQGILQPLTGAVTFCQRFGSFLQLSPHFHSWLPDGVFAFDEQGQLIFQRLPPPETQEIALLLGRIKRRVFALLNKADPEDIAEQDLLILKDQERAIFSQQLSFQAESIAKSRCVFGG
jgi:hypothetical protein